MLMLMSATMSATMSTLITIDEIHRLKGLSLPFFLPASKSDRTITKNMPAALSTVLYGIERYCMILHGIVWYCMALHGIEWYYKLLKSQRNNVPHAVSSKGGNMIVIYVLDHICFSQRERSYVLHH